MWSIDTQSTPMVYTSSIDSQQIMSKFTQMNIADWDPEAVEHWALHYGFKEKKVIQNIRIFHIGGKELLSGKVTADYLEMTVPIARRMLVARIDELIDRDLVEKARNEAIQKIKKKGARFIIEANGNNSKDLTVLNQVVSSENDEVATNEDKDEMLDEGAEESDKGMAVNKAPKSIFRLQLEEEDRKARSAKVIPSFVLLV
jgi:hypothetical protein